jgi:hypothetical protein
VRKSEGKRESEKEGEREKEGRREREKRGRERCRIWMLYFLFFTGMTGALAPFGYLVLICIFISKYL